MTKKALGKGLGAFIPEEFGDSQRGSLCRSGDRKNQTKSTPTEDAV